MPFKDIHKRNEYARKWAASRRMEFFKDKCCVRCGSTENLELDHIDPSTKISHSIWSWSKERRDAETAKCQVLCKDCHQNKSDEEKRRPVVHGTHNGYASHGCRCAACVKAQLAHVYAWREKIGGRSIRSLTPA